MYGPVGLPPCVRPGVSEFGLLFLTGYIRTGSIFLAQTQDRLISLKRINSRLKYVMRLEAFLALLSLTSARGPVNVIVPLCSVAALSASRLRSFPSREWPSFTLSSTCTTWWGPCTSPRMPWCPPPMWPLPWQALPPKTVSRFWVRKDGVVQQSVS